MVSKSQILIGRALKLKSTKCFTLKSLGVLLDLLTSYRPFFVSWILQMESREFPKLRKCDHPTFHHGEHSFLT